MKQLQFFSEGFYFSKNKIRFIDGMMKNKEDDGYIGFKDEVQS